VLAENASFLGAVKVAVLVRLMLYAAVAAASLRLRRLGYCETAAPMELPGGAVVAWAALVLCLAIIAQSTWAEFAGVGLALAPGVVVLLALSRSAGTALARPDDTL
jgi:hypothetical protein